MTLESRLSRRIRGPRALVAALPLLAILAAACGSATEPDDAPSDDPPPGIDFLLTTDDPADTIRVVSNLNANWGDQVGICLTLSTESGWWKGLGIDSSDPTLEVEDEGSGGSGREACRATAPDNVNFTLWKAKLLGAHTRVGTHSQDLTQYAGHTVRFNWRTD